MIQPGQILQQRYRVDKKIGQGGMGSVFVATDERFGSVVAIKQTLLMDDSYRKAIEREARLLNSLKHPALPRVTDHFLEDDGQFLVMEFIPGEDLGHTLERDARPFAVGEVLGWADQLLDALDFLHNQTVPVIHRDIKPQNLKLTPDGRIVLLDFGLAKGNPTDAAHQTAAKSLFGYSRSYASLEQIQGTGTDPRSDIYSLAATLYHLMTGVPPEDALTRAMAVLSDQPDPLIPANKARDEITPGVAGILKRCMDLNAGGRPASASEMREMLKEPEKYASFSTSGPSPAHGTKTDLSAQPTQIMPTSGRDTKNVDRDTAILSDPLSEETRIRPSRVGLADIDRGNFGRQRSRRRGLLGVGTAVVIIAGAALSYYFVVPSLIRSQTTVESPAATENSASESPANSITADATGEDGNAEKVEKPKTALTEKVPETSRTTKQNGTPTTRSRTSDDNDDPDPDDPDINIGNVRIHKGRVETPEMTVDENGVVMRNPKSPNIPGMPPLNRQQLRQMMPAQRRQLRMLYRRNGQNWPNP